MTFQQDQIQALINEIDGVLQKTTPRLPWVMSGDATQQRQTLERIRNFLVDLQQGFSAAPVDMRSSLMAYDISYQPSQAELGMGQGFVDAPIDPSAQQLLQLLAQEIATLRADLLQPLQAEMETLRQQRQLLLQEIQQLKGQQPAYLQPQGEQTRQLAVEIVQVLMTRLQETLPYQIAQGLQALPETNRVDLSPDYQASQQIRAIQAQSDELLVNLDTTVRIVFESLQRDIQAYQASLSQGIEQMHTLGQQGEMMFSALVSHLAQQIGREASSYLQSANQRTDAKPASTLPASLTVAPVTPPEPTSPAATPPTMGLPYPGVELPPPPSPASTIDGAIDQWLTNLREEPERIVGDGTLPLVNLDDVNLAAVEAAEIDRFLDQSSQLTPEQINDSPVEDTEDIDAALQLLEELNHGVAQPSDLADVEAVIDQVLGIEGSSTSPMTAPQLYAEVDDLYQSMFGGDSSGAEEQSSAADAPMDFAADALTVSPPSLSVPAVEDAVSHTLPDVDPTAGWDLGPVVMDSVTPITKPPLVSLPEPEVAETTNEITNALNDDLTDFDPTAGWDLGSVATNMEIPVVGETTLAMPSTPEGEADASWGILPLPEPPSAAPVTPLPKLGEGAIDEINALTDLLEDFTVPDDFATTRIPQPASGFGLDASTTADSLSVSNRAISGIGDDPYVPASPEEVLLPEPLPPDNSSGFWLDEATLSDLSEDLSNLEAGFSDRGVPPLTFEETTGFGDFGSALESVSAPDSPKAPDATPIDIPDVDTLAAFGQEFLEATEPPLEGVIPLATGSSEETPIAAVEPLPESSLIDDLFGDFGISDAAPEPQPVPSVPPVPDDFLEGFGSPDTTPESSDPVPVLGEFLEDFGTPSTPTALPPIAPSLDDFFQNVDSGPELAASTGAGSDFTLEGMDDLFADVPTVAATPVPPPATATPSAPSTFGPGGIDDFFEAAPPIMATPITPPGLVESTAAATEGEQVAFTLEGMDDLFGDAPASPGSTSSLEAVMLTEDAAFLPAEPTMLTTPESLDTQLLPATSDTEKVAFTLEEIEGIFTEVEVPITAIAQPPSRSATPAFSLENYGGVFVEVSTSGASEEQLAAASGPSQIDDLFSDLPPRENRAEKKTE